jgi:hypothetical protein
MHDILQTIIEFLTGIGILITEGAVPGDAFLRGVRISQGTLVFDRATLRWPGDLLHEAGHIAVTPAALRTSLDGALDASASLPHAGEVEAIAWSFAAVVHLGLDPSVLFHPEGYKGQSSGLLLTYSAGVYPGAFGLAQAGMTLVGAQASAAGIPAYPHMTQWLRT